MLDACNLNLGPEQPVWLRRSELSKRWNVPEATLSQWASQKRGPRYARFGRHVRYRLTDVIEFENAHMR